MQAKSTPSSPRHVPLTSLTPPPGASTDPRTCSGAEGTRSSIERGVPLGLERDADGGPCTLQSDCLLSTGEEVDELVDLLRSKDFRVGHISLNLSDRMEVSVLKRLLAAVDAHPELRYLDLRVNGSDTAPIPPPWRDALAASYAFVANGGRLARHRLFDDQFRSLSTVFQGESLQTVRRELDDFLNFGVGYGRCDGLRRDRAGLISGMALLMKDGLLMRALATLSPLQTIVIDQKLPYMGQSRVLGLRFIDESMSALGLSYQLELDVRNTQDFETLMEWLSSPRAPCRAICLSFSESFFRSTRAGEWEALQTALMEQTSLRSVRMHPEWGLEEVGWRVAPASDGGRAPVRLNVCLTSRQIDIKALTGLLGHQQPTHLTLKAERPEDIASVLACLKQPSAVATLSVSWREADGKSDALDRQLLRFGHATTCFHLTKSCWDGMQAQRSSAIETLGPSWFNGFTIVKLTDLPGPGFSIPGPAKVAYWEKGMQYFFLQEPFQWPMELSLSRYKDEGDGLSIKDCGVLTQVTHAAHLQAAKFIREQRAMAIAEGLQDGRIDRPMLRLLLTDASGQMDQELTDAVLLHLPDLRDEWASQRLSLTDH